MHPDVSAGKSVEGGLPRFWCLECGAEAGRDCEEHSVIGLRKHRRDQTAEAAALLARAARLHRDLGQRLAALLPAIQAEVNSGDQRADGLFVQQGPKCSEEPTQLVGHRLKLLHPQRTSDFVSRTCVPDQGVTDSDFGAQVLNSRRF